tara:strand:+ start:626 stop:835 length:210 start_codon:yes stop_codon:yes gene_type:complete
MTVTRKQVQLKDSTALESYFQGAIVDENGREIPITRDMITEACDTLEAQRIRHSFSQKRVDSESNKRFS